MMKSSNKIYKIIKWTARILAAVLIVFSLPFYFGYGNPLPFMNSEYTFLDNMWLAIFPVMYIGLALGWKLEKTAGYMIALTIGVGQIANLIVQGTLVIHMLLPFFTGIIYIGAGYMKPYIQKSKNPYKRK